MTSGWRQPTDTERALLQVLGRAESCSLEIVEQLASVLVRSSCGCGCGCLELRTLAATGPRPRMGRSYVVEAEGRDPQGRRALVSLVAVDGQLAELEIAPIAADEIAPPLPESLVQLDAVPRGTLALRWMVPRAQTILEELARRSA